jgi:hypothetical protein
MKWFRLYDEFQHDTKLRRMPIPHRYAFVILLCMANRSSVRGVILNLDDEDLAFELEMPVKEWLALRETLTAKRLIEVAEGGIKIVNWEEKHEPPKHSISSHIYRKHQGFVFDRDGHKCVYCSSTNQLTLDHKIPQSKGGSHDPENLVTCCLPCNSSKGAKPLEEWLGVQS